MNLTKSEEKQRKTRERGPQREKRTRHICGGGKEGEGNTAIDFRMYQVSFLRFTPAEKEGEPPLACINMSR